MKTENTAKKDATGISRRAMLGKSAKYAALIPAASLIVTKANAHTYTGSSLAECEVAPGAPTNPTSHCLGGSHPTVIPPV